MKTKQTAIQWLEDNLNFEPYDEEEFISNNKIWEQAKQMEKEQIKDTYLASTIQFANDARMDYPKLPEQYYNETYGK
jgi:hypothetical protein